MRRYLVAISDAASLCGVEAFSRHLADRLHRRGKRHVLNFDVAALLKALASSDGLVLNFPVVAWKKRLVEPTLAVFLAKLRRRKVTVILHEWASLNWKRRAVLWPVVLLADAILFSAPEIRREFEESRFLAARNKPSALIPIPPNIAANDIAEDAPAALMIREQRRLGRTVIGQFGSIYPQKNCAELLNIARILLADGHDVAVAFIGSFIKAMDDVEADFHRQVEQHGLAGRVLVTGYVGTDREVFAAFREVDVFCYRFTEGLTSRRGSVLAAAASGRTVVTNAPRDPDSLAHHGLFQTLIAGGNIVTCPTDADAGAMAAAVARAIGNGPPASQDFEAEVDKLWQAVIERLDEVQR